MRLNASLASLDGLGLDWYSDQEYYRFSLYDSALGVKSMREIAIVEVYGEGDYGTVETSEGKHGYGALCYLLAMQLRGGIASDRQEGNTSPSAEALWKKFYDDPRIKHTPIMKRKDWHPSQPRWLRCYYSMRTPFFDEQEIEMAESQYEEWKYGVSASRSTLNASLPSIEEVGLSIYEGSDGYTIFELYTDLHTRVGVVEAYPREGYYSVEGGWGPEGGYGALTYLIAMQVLGDLASDEGEGNTSSAAQDLWQRFYNDPRIEHTPISSRNDWVPAPDYGVDIQLKYAYSMKAPFFTKYQIENAKNTYNQWKAERKSASKLTEFLLNARPVPLNCPAIQDLINAIADYFGGIKPKISSIDMMNYQEWLDKSDAINKKNGEETLTNRVKGYYIEETQEIGVKENSLPQEILHEMVHGVLSSNPNATENNKIEEFLTDAVAFEICENLGLDLKPLGGYRKGREQLKGFLQTMELSVREFANRYVATVNVNDQNAALKNLVINRFHELGGTRANATDSWDELFSLLDIKLEEV